MNSGCSSTATTPTTASGHSSTTTSAATTMVFQCGVAALNLGPSTENMQTAFTDAGFDLKIGLSMSKLSSQAPVHRALSSSMARILAVKSWPLHAGRDGTLPGLVENNVGDLKAELESLTNLQHPRLVRMFGHVRTDRHLHLLLEMVSHGSLEGHVSSFGAMEGSALVWAIRGISEGLRFLHSRNLPHGNLKSSKALIDTSMNIKLTDFGSIGFICHQDSTMNADSLQWSAPEKAQGLIGKNRCSAMKADIWSLGCVLVEAATAKKPWGEATPDFVHAALLQTHTEGPSPLVPPTLTEAGRMLAQECFKRTPAQRLSAEDLSLHPFLSKRGRSLASQACGCEGDADQLRGA
mmetsp:Transcript_80585/g.209462  ORF Transcript_80585/g.209462 Transcript_80585/m.209462 type:complete len:351 (+) Transcript_80585:1-1053(+)